MKTESLVGKTVEPNAYECGHGVLPPTSLSRPMYDLSTKNTPILCPTCRVLLLTQRIGYYMNPTNAMRGYESLQLLFQVIDAKLYASPETWLSLVDRWSFGAAMRLDGDEKVSQETKEILSVLSYVQGGSLIMDLVQGTRQINNICSVHGYQRNIFEGHWRDLQATHHAQLSNLGKALDPTLACKEFSQVADRNITSNQEQNQEPASPHDVLTPLLKTRPWNPQVAALRSRLQEAVERGDLTAKLDEEMTNAEEVMSTLLAVQRSIAIGELQAKTGKASRR